MITKFPQRYLAEVYWLPFLLPRASATSSARHLSGTAVGSGGATGTPTITGGSGGEVPLVLSDSTNLTLSDGTNLMVAT